MPEWLIVALGVVAGFVLVWGALIAVLWGSNGARVATSTGGPCCAWRPM